MKLKTCTLLDEEGKQMKDLQINNKQHQQLLDLEDVTYEERFN